MSEVRASDGTPRTTIDIDAAVLRELKRRPRREGRSLGQLVSEPLATSLRSEERVEPPPFPRISLEPR